MLIARSLVCAHPGATDATAAPQPLDFTIEAGEWVVVVGPNGSGKTALLLTLAGLVPVHEGVVIVAGGVANERPATGIVFQEPETQFVTDAVAREIAFPLENLGWSRSAIEARVEELIAAFDLNALTAASPARLSGGEMQRVALATAIAPRPAVLLLDEPAAYLDAEARAVLARAVERLRTEHGLAIVSTACERGECPEAGRAIHLEARSVSRSGGDTVETPAPQAREPVIECARGELLWRAEGLALTRGDARGERTLWGGIDFEILSGETWVILGRNGSGKTSLLDVLAGWLRPTSGRLDAAPTINRSHALGYLGQFPEFQLFAATAAQDVAFGIRARNGTRGKALESAAAAALERAGLDPATVADRAPESLSLGERRRLALAGVLAAQPSILLLDEPTVGLDPEGRAALYSAIDAQARRGVTVIVASHDPGWARLPGARSLVLGPRRGPGNPVTVETA